MKTLLLFLFTAICIVKLYAQDNNCQFEGNLVLNPDFEKFHIKQRDSVDIYYCNNWYGSTVLTPSNYWHRNDSTRYGLIGLDYSAYSGEACMGFMPISWSGYIEILIGELYKPLVKGEKYQVKFYIKHGGDSVEFKLWSIQAKLTRKKFILDMEPFLCYDDVIIANDNKGDLYFDINNIKGWQCVSSVYKANGGEKYITLGIFYNKKLEKDLGRFGRLRDTIDKNIYNPIYIDKEDFIKKKNYLLYQSKSDINTECGHKLGAYYFIDCVSVIKLD